MRCRNVKRGCPRQRTAAHSDQPLAANQLALSRPSSLVQKRPLPSCRTHGREETSERSAASCRHSTIRQPNRQPRCCLTARPQSWSYTRRPRFTPCRASSGENRSLAESQDVESRSSSQPDRNDWSQGCQRHNFRSCRSSQRQHYTEDDHAHATRIGIPQVMIDVTILEESSHSAHLV